MPRTALTKVVIPGPYPALPVVALSLDFVFTACDNVNGNQFTYTGKEIILIQNSTGGGLTATLTSAPDAQGRSGDITTYAVAANGFCVFDPGARGDGWKQSDGNFYLTGSAVGLKYAILQLQAAAGR